MKSEEAIVNKIDELRTRLEELDTRAYDAVSLRCLAHEAIKLLSQLEAENRWVPVSEKLPPLGDTGCSEHLTITTEDDHTITKIEVNQGFLTKDGKWWCDTHKRYMEVLAWQPLPKPFVKEEE